MFELLPDWFYHSLMWLYCTSFCGSPAGSPCALSSSPEPRCVARFNSKQWLFRHQGAFWSGYGGPRHKGRRMGPPDPFIHFSGSATHFVVQITSGAVKMMRSLVLYVFLLYSLSCLTHASTISSRQYQDSGYSTCARGCFEPNVDASGCPFDISGTRNACLCWSNTFLTNFMTCTF
jgi:hypothetical protein